MRQDGEQMKKLRMAEGNSVSRWGLLGPEPGKPPHRPRCRFKVESTEQRPTSLFSLISAWGLRRPHGVLLRR